MLTSDTPDTTPLHSRYAPTAFPMPASCVPVFARMPVHSSCIVSEGQPTFRLYAARIASRLARGHAPLNPTKAKGGKGNEARQACPHCRRLVRVLPDERDILRFNAGLYGMSMSEYIRQTCLGIRLRKTPEEKRRQRELARTGRI